MKQDANEYRGWAVTWDYGYFTATSPDYDASYEGHEDGWVDNGLRTSARTLPDLYSEVDAMLDDGVELERFFKLPLSLREPDGEEGAFIVDADGKSVAMMMWPGHAPEDADAAEQATYALGRMFVRAVAA